MKLLWDGSWIEVPPPSPVPVAVRLEVEATIPVAPVPSPSGRTIRAPYRKALRFMALEGPGSTIRKARSKRHDSALTSDYRIVAVLGRRVDEPGGGAVLALALRSASCAHLVLCHRDLVGGSEPTQKDLRGFASILGQRRDELVGYADQSYLYSGEEPPEALKDLVRAAISSARTVTVAEEDLAVIAPPSEPVNTDEPLRLEGATGSAGKPVAILGAGDYARTQILPPLRRTSLRPYVIADREPQIATAAARLGGFEIASTSAEGAIRALPAPGLVVIATNHDSHARLATQALAGGHRVFVEKPVVVTAEDLAQVTAAIAKHPGQLDVGFNRRHHPLTQRLRDVIADEDGPLTILCTVREISIAPNHWYFWPNQGTRVSGNLCHWIDLGISLLPPETRPVDVSVSPPVAGDRRQDDAERTVTVGFDDGSMLAIVATDRGDDLRGVQETIEVRRGLATVSIDDYRSMSVLRDGRRRRTRRLWRTKGHELMFDSLFSSTAAGSSSYPEADVARVAHIQLAATALFAEGGRKQL